jgi:hypothetical protein
MKKKKTGFLEREMGKESVPLTMMHLLDPMVNEYCAGCNTYVTCAVLHVRISHIYIYTHARARTLTVIQYSLVYSYVECILYLLTVILVALKLCVI